MGPRGRGATARRSLAARIGTGAWFLVSFGCLLPAGAAAQVFLPPAGARVRVTLASSEKLVGTLAGAHRDTLLVRPVDAQEARALPLGTLTRLEVSRGIHSRTGRGALIGLVGGAAAGAAGGMIACAGGNCVHNGEDLTTLVPVALGIGTGVLGAGVGALLGSGVRGESWATVPLPRSHASLNLRGRPEGLRLALTLRL